MTSMEGEQHKAHEEAYSDFLTYLATASTDTAQSRISKGLENAPIAMTRRPRCQLHNWLHCTMKWMKI